MIVRNLTDPRTLLSSPTLLARRLVHIRHPFHSVQLTLDQLGLAVPHPPKYSNSHLADDRLLRSSSLK